MNDTDTLGLFDLSGRRAIVSGGAGLLGGVFAAALLDLGATVHLIDSRQAPLQQVASTLSPAAPGRVATCLLDITDADAVDEVVAGIAKDGPIDILVNSAAIDPKAAPVGATPDAAHGLASRYPVSAWRASLEVNLTGTFLLTRACCYVMERQGASGRGVVVNISSTYGLRGPDQRIYESLGVADDQFVKPVDYSVTKAGVLGFTRALAAQYRGTQIRVNALVPGGAFAGQPADFVRAYADHTILGRMAEPADYKGAIAYLCSDASSYMTGSYLVVDGGWTAF